MRTRQRNIVPADLSALDGADESVQRAVRILAAEGWYRIRAYGPDNCCIAASRMVCDVMEHAGVRARAITVGVRVEDAHEVRVCPVVEPVQEPGFPFYRGHVVPLLTDFGDLMVDLSFPQFQLKDQEEFGPLIATPPADWLNGEAWAIEYREGVAATYTAYPQVLDFMEDRGEPNAWLDEAMSIMTLPMTRRYDKETAA